MFAHYLTSRSQGDLQYVDHAPENVSPKARSQCSTLGKLCSCVWWTQWPSCLGKVVRDMLKSTKSSQNKLLNLPWQEELLHAQCGR